MAGDVKEYPPSELKLSRLRSAGVVPFSAELVTFAVVLAVPLAGWVLLEGAGETVMQWTSELFYRLQLAENVAITPSVQVIVNPALNADEEVLGLFGVRARVTF